MIQSSGHSKRCVQIWVGFTRGRKALGAPLQAMHAPGSRSAEGSRSISKRALTDIEKLTMPKLRKIGWLSSGFPRRRLTKNVRFLLKTIFTRLFFFEGQPNTD